MSCNFRSSHQKCSIKKGFLKNSRKFTGKHLRIFQNFTRTPFWKNISGWLLKTRLWQRCFLVNTLFLENPRWLLLFWVSSLPTLQLSHFEYFSSKKLLTSEESKRNRALCWNNSEMLLLLYGFSIRVVA